MKRIHKIYSYSAATGVEIHAVRDHRRGTLVRDAGLSGEVLRVADLDVPGARYFTTPLLAVEAFISKARAALRSHPDPANEREWRGALDAALNERLILTGTISP